MEILEMSASAAAAQMRAGALAPQDYLQAVLDRIEATEPEIRAWESLDVASARRQAEALANIPPAERSGMALFGIPVGVKDVIDVAGHATSADFEPNRGKAIREDSAVVERLRKAGCIILGKTTTAQFAWGQDAPKTRNPWNFQHTPGASSTGTPAAVAARQIPVGVGTQTAGSLLRPSSYCGVVGLKPTYGRISCFGVLPTSWSSDHPGFSTRSVADAALMLQATAGHDPRDPHSARLPVGDYVGAAVAGKPPRLGVLRDYIERSDPAVRTAFEADLKRLEAEGAKLVDVRLPVAFEMIQAVHWAISSSEGSAIHAEQFARFPDDYLPTVRERFEVSQTIPAAVYIQAKRLHRRYRPLMVAMFEGLDGLVAPVSSDRPPRVDFVASANRLGSSSFQIPSSCFGFPAISIPTGVGENNLPTALQVIVGSFLETRLFAIAAWCESVLPKLPVPHWEP